MYQIVNLVLLVDSVMIAALVADIIIGMTNVLKERPEFLSVGKSIVLYKYQILRDLRCERSIPWIESQF